MKTVKTAMNALGALLLASSLSADRWNDIKEDKTRETVERTLDGKAPCCGASVVPPVAVNSDGIKKVYLAEYRKLVAQRAELSKKAKEIAKQREVYAKRSRRAHWVLQRAPFLGVVSGFGYAAATSVDMVLLAQICLLGVFVSLLALLAFIVGAYVNGKECDKLSKQCEATIEQKAQKEKRLEEIKKEL